MEYRNREMLEGCEFEWATTDGASIRRLMHNLRLPHRMPDVQLAAADTLGALRAMLTRLEVRAQDVVDALEDGDGDVIRDAISLLADELKTEVAP